jgi:hypothetical protein
VSGGPLAGLLDLARRARLYPAVILHGGSVAARRDAALELTRTLLCAQDEPEARPCRECRHCRRVAWPDEKSDAFHPDFAVLARDLKTATSAEATRAFLRAAHSSPFEARGQVFVVGEADTLSGEAGDALLKLLEEPGAGAPRHFLLLAPSRLDLPETLRSRSLAVFLGPAESAPEELLAETSRSLAGSLARWRAGGGGLFLLDAAARLATLPGFEDPRADAPWSAAAEAVRRAALGGELPAELRRPLFALAEDLLAAPSLRLRGIPPERILEGLLARHLAAGPTT